MAGFDFQRWKGTKDLIPGKVHYARDATKSQILTDWQGPYQVILALQPNIGNTIAGFPVNHRITSVKITELDGDAGKMDIILEAGGDNGGPDSDALGEPTYEVEWTELQKPLETHRDCGHLNETRAHFKDGASVKGANAYKVGKQRTWEDWQQLTSTDDFTDGDYVPIGAYGSVGWSLAQYKEKKAEGIDSYLMFNPIIRRTSYHLSLPPDVGAATGTLTLPPLDHIVRRAGSSYFWLGGPDRCVAEGRKYTRTTEWLGAEFWEPQVYPD